MALKKYTLRTTAEDARKRLDQFLADRLPEALAQPLSKAKARKLIVAGAVYLNGKRVRIASKELLPRAIVDIFVDLARLHSDEAAKDRPFEMRESDILYEDEQLIAVNKPAGLPTQPTLDEARSNLFAVVKKFLARREGVVDPYVGLHHRLDRDTSGVVLFTKKTEANAGVAELFSGHLAKKTYQALTHRPRGGQSPSSEWVVRNHLGKVPGKGKKAKYGAVRSGGDAAITEFKLLEAFPTALWVEARPMTGRTHQIRVHLSEDGMPILGDGFYGAREGSAPRVMLHAVNLTFPHPITKNLVSISSPLPEDFQKCLNALRKPGTKPGGAS